MATNFTNTLNVIVGQNLVVAALTILITGAYLIFLGLENISAAEQIREFVVLLVGFWTAKVGTGLAVAQEVKKQTVKAQSIRKDNDG